MGAGSWVVMIAVMAAFWGLVILAGVMIFRGSDRSRGGDRTQDRTALEILDDRFARGEVDREEYEARKAVLRGTA
ncbi:SHOCT domain-containing protein [Aeromicrobium sp. A1-2]|uniref:SHOCT domain-containing protein n=1 Tax=Aeromicrobium sp. A1-2 TaxID=2107713 RepID=UPI001C1F83BC|nr:SHOCT domain-containing protein [Aeromicrobium sp. A1-2]